MRAWNDQVAIVTGSAQGIGAGIASHLGALGAKVAILDVDARLGKAAEQRLREGGCDCRFWECDLSLADSVTSVVAGVWADLGRVDVVVNNAVDHGPRLPMLQYSVAQWEAVIRTNLTGTFWLTSEVVRRMASDRIAGNVVNVLAIQSEVPISGYGAYVASKGGLEALTRAMAVEFAPLGIRANGVMLGAIYSGSTRGASKVAVPADVDYEAVPADLDTGVPNLVARMGRPSDVARVVAMLAAPDASYLTGSVIVVDGGRLLNRGTDPFSPPTTPARAREGK